MLAGKRILLVVSGGIAAYKCLELIRRLGERGARVRCVLTRGGAQFVTPLALAALSGDKVYSDLFSLTDESEIGHIRLAREADVVVVAPASADILAKMAAGIADDLATAILLATDRPILVAPAMNVRMWSHPATQANIATLEIRGVRRVGPAEGEMAERGESGMGRMAEPADLLAAIEFCLGAAAKDEKRPLDGLRAVVTSGPTIEPIDPVRFLSNRSSGKQGHAIAAALAGLGAQTTLVTGPVRLADPPNVRVVRVETAEEMMAACRRALPVDIAVCAAAVSDWRAEKAVAEKIKKGRAGAVALRLVENPDILAALGRAGRRRPRLVVGFAAETGNLVANARAKLRAKGCDWMVANDVSQGTETLGGDTNEVHLVTARGVEHWPRLPKEEVAQRLAERIAETLARRDRRGRR